MADIPRRSEFSLTDKERNMLRKQNEQALRKYIEGAKSRGRERTEEQASALLLINLFYDIGMQDYWIYRDVNNDSPKQGLGDWVKKHLASRAFDSARLQVLIDDMKIKGYDVESILDPKLGDVFEYKTQNASSPDMLYHGTAEELEPSQIGVADERGFYGIRDGISYWTTDYGVAERYSSRVNPDQRERGLIGGNVYSRGIENGTLCTTIAETHGGAFAMWQDELIRLNQMGVRYVFSAEQGRSDVLDIGNFADFVQKRDDCLERTMNEYGLRLPEKAESLSDYFTSISQFEHDGKKYKGYMIIEDSSIPYLLVIPDEMKDNLEIIVESLNKESDKRGDIDGFDDRSTVSALGTAKNILKSVKDAPVVIPIVPSIDGEGYYQELSRDCLKGKTTSERIDTQYLKCIESAKEKIKEITGKSVAEKVFLNGYSASGVFAQRFALIHPEVVSKCCIGGAVGSIPIPDETLPYPCGIKDFKELFGREFDLEDYKKIGFAYYVGEHEASRPGNYGKDGQSAFREVISEDGKRKMERSNPSIPIMPMHDMSYHPRSMDYESGEMLRSQYGETMQERLDNTINYYHQNGFDFKSKIYKGVAHNDVRYRNIGVNNPNIENHVAYFGIFSDHPSVVDISQRLHDDIAAFYESGNGFEFDDKSVQKMDMREQEQRDAYAQRNSQTRLGRLEKEQEQLLTLLNDKKSEYEQLHSKTIEKNSYEKS